MEETTGQLLKSRREEKGISLDQAVQETRIRLSYLKALEEDDLDSFPGSTYRKGFLHNYAQFLGIEELEDQYQQEQLLAHLLPEEGRSGKLSGKKGILLAGAILLVSVVSLFLHYSLNAPSPEAIKHIPKDDLVAEREMVLVLPPKEILEEEKVLAKNEQSQKLEERKDDLAVQNEEQVLVPLEEQELDEIPFTSILPPKEQEEQDLILFALATQEVWIRVVTDRKDTFTYLLDPSDKKTFRANDRIKIRIGNAGGLRLRLNNKDLDPLGKSGQVVNKVFTKEDVLSQ